MMTLRTQSDAHIARLEDFVRRRDYKGYDPYDALNSTLLSALTRGSKWGRIACTQLLKRCPVNLRPLVGIRPGENPKALGLFLEAYARLYRREPNQAFAGSARRLIRRLAALRSPAPGGHGWGYNFDWQSRA